MFVAAFRGTFAYADKGIGMRLSISSRSHPTPSRVLLPSFSCFDRTTKLSYQYMLQRTSQECLNLLSCPDLSVTKGSDYVSERSREQLCEFGGLSAYK